MTPDNEYEFRNAIFDDKRNVTVGVGRVIYARSSMDRDGRYFPEGWVLPGGARTDNHERAYAVARAIDESFGDGR